MLRINEWKHWWAYLVFSSDHAHSPYQLSFSLFFSLLLPCFCLAFEKRREEIYGVKRIQRQAAGLTVDATNAPGSVLPCRHAKAQSPTTADPPHRSLQRNAVNFSRFSTALNFLLLFVSRQKEVINTPTGKHNKSKVDKYSSTERQTHDANQEHQQAVEASMRTAASGHFHYTLAASSYQTSFQLLKASIFAV